MGLQFIISLLMSKSVRYNFMLNEHNVDIRIRYNLLDQNIVSNENKKLNVS